MGYLEWYLQLAALLLLRILRRICEKRDGRLIFLFASCLPSGTGSGTRQCRRVVEPTAFASYKSEHECVKRGCTHYPLPYINAESAAVAQSLTSWRDSMQ